MFTAIQWSVFVENKVIKLKLRSVKTTIKQTTTTSATEHGMMKMMRTPEIQIKMEKFLVVIKSNLANLLEKNRGL